MGGMGIVGVAAAADVGVGVDCDFGDGTALRKTIAFF